MFVGVVSVGLTSVTCCRLGVVRFWGRAICWNSLGVCCLCYAMFTFCFTLVLVWLSTVTMSRLLLLSVLQDLKLENVEIGNKQLRRSCRTWKSRTWKYLTPYCSTWEHKQVVDKEMLSAGAHITIWMSALWLQCVCKNLGNPDLRSFSITVSSFTRLANGRIWNVKFWGHRSRTDRNKYLY